MSIIDICYTSFYLDTQTVSPNLPGFQVLKRCIKYMASQPHKSSIILLIIMVVQMSSDLHGVGIKLNTTKTIIV